MHLCLRLGIQDILTGVKPNLLADFLGTHDKKDFDLLQR
jgi:hypothetical protein